MSAIDPGVEDGIKEGANEIETNREQDDEGEGDEFLQPNRWWFASVACPLLAGTFGPMASGFNICALVQYWRQTMPPGPAIEEQGHKIADPTWLIVSLRGDSIHFVLSLYPGCQRTLTGLGAHGKYNATSQYGPSSQVLYRPAHYDCRLLAR